MHLTLLIRILLLAGVLFICSCAKPAVAPFPNAHVPPENLPQIGTSSPQKQTTPARPAIVDNLIRRAEKQLNQHQPDAAFRTLERALTIDGRDPLIWHLMAKARLDQGQFDQARSLARKSNTLAADDHDLKAKNSQIITAASEL